MDGEEPQGCSLSLTHRQQLSRPPLHMMCDKSSACTPKFETRGHCELNANICKRARLAPTTEGPAPLANRYPHRWGPTKSRWMTTTRARSCRLSSPSRKPSTCVPPMLPAAESTAATVCPHRRPSVCNNSALHHRPHQQGGTQPKMAIDHGS